MSSMPPASLKPIDVFTPNDYPRHTYVNRAVNPPLENQLRRALATPKEVISISGPSKSGKSVLIERVVDTNNLITVSGSEISSVASLWERVLDWMGAPSSRTQTVGTARTSGTGTQLSGSAGLPMSLLKGGLTASTQNSTTETIGATTSQVRRGLAQVQEEISGSRFCVLLDDFHYIPRDVQIDIGKQIKTAAERDIRIITASVPHRSDDVVRSNSELRGRTFNIDTEFWTISELKQIANLGFKALNMQINEKILGLAASNACGSPQLMQRICLNICFDLGVSHGCDVTRHVSVAEVNLQNIFAITLTNSDYKTLLQTMHAGPKTRGTERNKYNFVDGSIGDVYRCILLAIRQDPPVMELPYSVLMDRVRQVCVGDPPLGRGVTEACGQISEFASAYRTVEFDTDADVETFYVSDPYWLFYLRCSPKLHSLAQEWHTTPNASMSP